jgi:protein-disulfide isomerase
MTRALRVALIVFPFSVTLNWRGLAQEKAAPAMQQQLDELKQGQERILQELQAIRSALQGTPARAETAARPVLPPVLNIHGEPFKGQSNAPVAIMEYSDFDCSHCAQFATKNFPAIDQKYIATGKVKFFFRDLPEAGNAESLLKAQFARCAGEQGRFWEAHDFLFVNRPTLIGSTLEQECQALGLDRTTVNACLKQEKYSIPIQRSAASAARLGIRGTPAFLIGRITDNGDILQLKQLLLGVQDVETLGKDIDQLLDGTAEKKNP